MEGTRSDVWTATIEPLPYSRAMVGDRPARRFWKNWAGWILLGCLAAGTARAQEKAEVIFQVQQQMGNEVTFTLELRGAYKTMKCEINFGDQLPAQRWTGKSPIRHTYVRPDTGSVHYEATAAVGLYDGPKFFPRKTSAPVEIVVDALPTIPPVIDQPPVEIPPIVITTPILSIQSAPAVKSAGDTFTFTAHYTGGVKAAGYRFHFDGDAGHISIKPSYDYTFAQSGTHRAYVEIGHATGAKGSPELSDVIATSDSIQVVVPKAELRLEPTVATVVAGNSVTFTASLSNGAAVRKFRFTPGDTKQIDAPRSSTFGHRYTRPGVFNAEISLEDSTARASVTVTRPDRLIDRLFLAWENMGSRWHWFVYLALATGVLSLLTIVWPTTPQPPFLPPQPKPEVIFTYRHGRLPRVLPKGPGPSVRFSLHPRPDRDRSRMTLTQGTGRLIKTERKSHG